MKEQFERFLKSAWELEVWEKDKVVFRSKESGVRGLLDFIEEQGRAKKNLIVFDKVVGRGAAFLVILIKADTIYGKLGSELAVQALKKYKIKFYFKETVSNIMNRDKTGICPFEQLSLGKTPEEFYKCLIDRD